MEGESGVGGEGPELAVLTAARSALGDAGGSDPPLHFGWAILPALCGKCITSMATSFLSFRGIA